MKVGAYARPQLQGADGKNEAGAGEAGFGFLEFGDVEGSHVEAGGLDAGARFGERGREDDRVGGRQSVCGERLGGVDVDPLEVGGRSCVERFRVEPRAICEERVPAEICYGGFEMEAAGDWNRHDVVAVRRKDSG